MPLQRGEVQGYINRMAVGFTMVNQGKVVLCSIGCLLYPKADMCSA